jgi:hypothetical protein
MPRARIHRAEGDEAAHGQRRERLHDAPERRGLPLVRRREADEDERSRVARAPAGPPGLAPRWMVEDRPDVADVGRHPGRGEVEAWAGQHVDLVRAEDLLVDRAQLGQPMVPPHRVQVRSRSRERAAGHRVEQRVSRATERAPRRRPARAERRDARRRQHPDVRTVRRGGDPELLARDERRGEEDVGDEHVRVPRLERGERLPRPVGRRSSHERIEILADHRERIGDLVILEDDVLGVTALAVRGRLPRGVLGSDASRLVGERRVPEHAHRVTSLDEAPDEADRGRNVAAAVPHCEEEAPGEGHRRCSSRSSGRQRRTSASRISSIVCSASRSSWPRCVRHVHHR